MAVFILTKALVVQGHIQIFVVGHDLKKSARKGDKISGSHLLNTEGCQRMKAERLNTPSPQKLAANLTDRENSTNLCKFFPNSKIKK